MRRVLAIWIVIPWLAACGGAAGTASTAGDAGESALVTGKLTADDGSVAGTTVSAPDAGVSRTCDADGEFDLGDLPAVRTRIHVRRNGHGVVEAWVDLTD